MKPPEKLRKQYANTEYPNIVLRFEDGHEIHVPKGSTKSFDCYAVDSGLLVGSVQTTESPMGSMEATTLLSEYKDFGGRKVPTKLVQSSMGQEQVVTITAIEYDNVPDSVFEAPPAVKAILEKKP